MGLIAWFDSTIKSEITWLMSSLAIATATNESEVAPDGAAVTDTAAHQDASPDMPATILAVADPESDSATTAGAASMTHASDEDAPASGVQDTPFTLLHADNLILPVDFSLDTPSQPLSAALTPPSLTDSFSGTAVTAEWTTQDQESFSPAGAPMENHSQSHWSMPNAGPGDFALASLDPKLGGDFAKGGTGGHHGGGGAGGSPYLTYDTSTNGGIGGGLDITLDFDASVARAPTTDQNGSPQFGFVQDMEDVANFLATNFSQSSAHITVDVGYGEIDGAHVSSSVLGESETYYVQVPTSSGSPTQYQALQAAYAAHDSGVTLPTTSPFTGDWLVTTAEGKALGLVANNSSVDGYIGFGNSSNLFFYNPSSPVSGENDFMGTAAHELTEIMGRETWNGAKSGGARQFMPLDLFHFADSNGAPIYSGTTAGHFALSEYSSPGVLSAPLEEFNTDSSGDYSDWATNAGYPPNSFDWAGGVGQETPVTYADYLVVEAAGYAGSYTGGESAWQAEQSQWWLI